MAKLITREPRTYTTAEIVLMTGWPVGKIYRLACADRWARTTDGRRPVLYEAGDVEATIVRIGVSLPAN